MKQVFLIVVLALAMSDDCDVSYRTDCGYSGIDQGKCESKGCCWRPTQEKEMEFLRELQLQDTPWCYYQSGGEDTCDKLNFQSTDPGFDNNFYQSMYSKFIQQIDIQGKGGVVAAPDHDTPGGNYYYHWARDAALTMRTFMEINDMDFNKVKDKMNSYIDWVLKVQSQTSPHGIDIRGEVKFELPDGEVYAGGWCRPQTDGPGLRATTLIMYANLLLENGQKDFVTQKLWTNGAYNGGAIKYDLDWMVNHWFENGCDIWEEIQSSDFFWNRMSFQYALSKAEDFANKMGDSELAQTYSSAASDIKKTLGGHWNGNFMFESSNRQKDSSVTHAFASFPGVYSPTSNEVSSTIKVFNDQFCHQFYINTVDNNNNIPGILYGRYEGDSYAGGNPWQLLTASLAELFYQGAVDQLNKGDELLSAEIHGNWKHLLNLSDNASTKEFALKATSAGDAVMKRIYEHVKNDGGRIDEQVDKSSGVQKSAESLTWSYANILRALHLRNSKLANQ